MNNGKQKEILVGGSVVYKKDNGKMLWFVVKNDKDSEWELAKTIVRRGESSVRAVIRAMAEQGGMKAKVLEEAGRLNKAVMQNGKPTDQKVIYYLLLERGGGEVLGFAEYQWLEYSKAVKKLENKKEQAILEKSKELAKEVEKQLKKNPLPEDDEEFELDLGKEEEEE